MKIGIASALTKPFTNFLVSLESLKTTLSSNHEVQIEHTIDFCGVDRARNVLTRKLLDDGCDYILYVDDDMMFDSRSVELMLEANKALVCGLMFRKVFPFSPTIMKINDRVNVRDVGFYGDYPSYQLFEIGACGFAFTLVDRIVLQDLEFEQDKWFKFDGFTSEDFDFCFRAREKGHRVWCDSRVKTRHIGGMGVGEENWLFWKDKGIGVEGLWC